MRILDDELRERIRKLKVMCEETKEVIRQMLEETERVNSRDDALKGHSDDVEESGK